MHAVDGKIMSGVVVATTMRSTSAGAMPARSSALRDAASARSDVCSSSAAMWRCADAGARADPLVAGVDALRELVVGQHLRGQIAARCRRCGYAWDARRIGGLRCGCDGRDGGHRRDPLRDAVEHAVRDFGVRLVQRDAKRERVRAAMALHDDALQADERRAVVAARIDAPLEAPSAPDRRRAPRAGSADCA